MKKTVRVLSIIVLFVLVTAGFAFFGNKETKAKADGPWTEVSTLAELEEALQGTATQYVRVVKDISYEVHYGNYTRYRITVKGTKTLDLNGHSVYFDDCSNLNESPNRSCFAHATSTFIRVPKNAELTVCDSGKGGRIRTSGYFIAMTNKGVGSFDIYAEQCERNGIEVEGVLTVTGGQIEAGDKKKQFIGKPLRLDGEIASVGHEAYHVIFGSAVIVKQGGYFLSLGGRYDGYGPYNATIRVNDNAYARFYDGLVCGQCSADCFDVGKQAELEVYGGTFETYCEKYLRKCDDLKGDVKNDDELKIFANTISGVSIGIYLGSMYNSNPIRHVVNTYDYGKIGIPKESFYEFASVSQNSKSSYESNYKGNTYAKPTNYEPIYVMTEDSHLAITYLSGSSQEIYVKNFELSKDGIHRDYFDRIAYFPKDYYDLFSDGKNHGDVKYQWYVSKKADLTPYEAAQKSNYYSVGTTDGPSTDVKAAMTLLETKLGKLKTGQTYYVAVEEIQAWSSRHDWTIDTFCISPLKVTIGGIPISTVTADLTGCTYNGFNITSSAKFGDLKITSKTAGVGQVSSTWYENGASVVTLFGENAWKTVPMINGSFRALVTFKAKDGYNFPADTKVTVGGQAAGVVGLSEDGTELIVRTGEYKVPCWHSYDGWTHDAVYHWHQCDLCGVRLDVAKHRFQESTDGSGNTISECLDCGYRITVANRTAISEVVLDLGSLAVGEKIPVITGFYGSVYDSRCALKQVSGQGGVRWSTGLGPAKKNYTPGVDTIEANKEYTIYGTISEKPGYYLNSLTEVKLIIDRKPVDAFVNCYFDSNFNSNVVDFSIRYTPKSDPTVAFTLPNDIAPGTDLIKLTKECGVKYDGNVADCMVEIYGYDSVGEEMFSIPLNIQTGGQWSLSDLNAYVKQLQEIGYSASQIEELRTRATARQGFRYSITVVAQDTAQKSTKEANMSVSGAKNATAISRNPDALSVIAVYHCSYDYITNVELTAVLPNLGDETKGFQVTTTDQRFRVTEVTCSQDKFSCEADTDVYVTVKANGNYKFDTDCFATLNGIRAPEKASQMQDGTGASFRISVWFDHELDISVTPATCTEEGKSVSKCKVCGKDFGEEIIPANGHTLTTVEGTSGDCVTEGEVMHYRCEVCGLLFSDEQGNTTITSTLGHKDPENHVGGEYEYDEENHWIKCQCGVSLQFAKHDFGEENICKVCGYEKGENGTTSESESESANETGAESDDGTGGKGFWSLWWLWLLLLLILLLIAGGVVGYTVYKKNKKQKEE